MPATQPGMPIPPVMPQVGGPVPTPPSNGLAIAALVLGILAIVGSFIPVLNIGAIILGALAIVLAIIALATHRAKSLAITGGVLALVGIIIAIVMNIAWSQAVDEALDQLGGGATPNNQPATTATANSSADTPADAGTAAPAASAAAYAVTIDGSHTTTDYEGKPTLVVNYTFTNNSTDAASFMFAISDKAFQNGVQLETAIVTGDDSYDSANSLNEVKPGASIAVQSAYVLDDQSDVTIECTELISFDDTVLASQVIKVS